MIIDSHGHACCDYMTLERILNTLDKNKIDKVILFPAETGKAKIDKISDSKNKEILYYSNHIGAFLTKFIDLTKKIDFSNTYIHYLKLLAPDKIIQFYQVTPKFLYKLQSDYEKMEFSGIKLHQCVSYFKIKSDFFDSVINFAEKFNLPIQIHLCGKKDALNLIDIVKKRNVKIIVGHLLYYKRFYEHWNDIKSNIFFDLASYYFINLSTIKYAIEKFGCNKLIFGSDNAFGINAIEKTINMILNLPIDQTEKDMIMGNNIKDILKL